MADFGNFEMPPQRQQIRLMIGEGIGASINFVVDLRFFFRYQDRANGLPFEVSQLYPLNQMPELAQPDDIIVYEGEEFTVLSIEIIGVDRTVTISDNSPAQILTVMIHAVRN